MNTSVKNGNNPLLEIGLENKQKLTGISHRLEFIRNINGISWINDSKSSDLESSLFSFEEIGSKAIWIMGADFEEINTETLSDFFPENVHRVILFGTQSGSYEDILDEIGVPFEYAESLEDAVEIARGFGIDVKTIVFSPATPGFDDYSNYRERGNHFKSIVNAL